VTDGTAVRASAHVHPSTPTVRVVLRSGYSFDVALSTITVTKDNGTQRATNLQYEWTDGQPWVYLDLNEVVAIVDLFPPDAESEPTS
jgi:hypothetical protein